MNRKHTRDIPIPLNAKKKDLFVRTKVPDANAGIRLFGKASGVNVVTDLQADEFPADRVMNFNHSGNTPHEVDQHGVLIELGKQTGYAVASPENHNLDTPRATDAILLPASLQNFFSGTTPLGTQVSGSVDYYAATVAHEIGHACAVWHHGELKENVQWYASQFGGTNELRETGGASGDVPIVMKTEAGADVTAALAQSLVTRNIRLTLIMATWNGLHSGDVGCLMRYEDDNTYAARPATSPPTRYWIAVETWGSALCTLPSGTIYNATSWKPQSRSGDCDTNRGKCLTQVCVSDKHFGDSKHHR